MSVQPHSCRLIFNCLTTMANLRVCRSGYLFVITLLLSQFPEHSVASFHARFCSPRPPNCECDVGKFHLSEDGNSCLACPSCEPGFALDKPCGGGLHGDAVCVPCAEGTFSDQWALGCAPCTVCTNAVETRPCDATGDRLCGDCLPGFFRSMDRFADHNACPNRCSDYPDAPECQDWWKTEVRGKRKRGGGGRKRGGRKGEMQTSAGEERTECADPEPPRCDDDCHGNRYYVGRDGLCKMCLQCQPGLGLDKICGNGKNGDAACLPCDDGTFSFGGSVACTPCRICVNTVELMSCSPDTDAECGDCLPGYFQGATGRFFDPHACPNRCADNPRNTPQCEEWWIQVDAASSKTSDSLTPPGMPGEGGEDGTLLSPDVQLFRDSKAEQVDVEVARQESFMKSDVEAELGASHLITIAVLASVLVAVIVIFVVAFAFLRLYRKRPIVNHAYSGDTVTTLLGKSDTYSSTEGAADDSPHGSPPCSSSARMYKESGASTASLTGSAKSTYAHQSVIQGIGLLSYVPRDNTLSSALDPTPTNTPSERTRTSDLLLPGDDSIQTTGSSPADRSGWGWFKHEVQDGDAIGKPGIDRIVTSSSTKADVEAASLRVVGLVSGGPGIGSPDQQGSVVVMECGGGSTRVVASDRSKGTSAYRRSSVVENPTGIPQAQVYRKNSTHLNQLGDGGKGGYRNGKHTVQKNGSKPVQMEPDAALFPSDPSEDEPLVDCKHLPPSHGIPSREPQRLREQRAGLHDVPQAEATSPGSAGQGKLVPTRRIGRDHCQMVRPINQQNGQTTGTTVTITTGSSATGINIKMNSAKIKKFQLGDVNEYNYFHHTREGNLRKEDEEVKEEEEEEDEEDEEDESEEHEDVEDENEEEQKR